MPELNANAAPAGGPESAAAELGPCQIAARLAGLARSFMVGGAGEGSGEEGMVTFTCNDPSLGLPLFASDREIKRILVERGVLDPTD
jgi:hypothetical protein